jgi:putative peptidoglycan lipid II flippase
MAVRSATESPDAAGKGGVSSLMRSGAIMALGTIASRITGLLRTLVLVAALGTHGLGDAYNTANTVPNNIYDLLLGGILTSVVVPMIVQARERDRRYGEDYEQRLFSIAVIALGVLTVLAVLLAPVIIDLFGSGWHGAQRSLAVEFAYFFLPQIFFYGIGAFASAMLNIRGRFGAPMWTPVLNNVVVIAVGAVFITIQTGTVDPAHITSAEKLMLEVGTTGGIILQTLALFPFLRAAGFRWRPRFDFVKGELSGIGRMAGWTLTYVVFTQIGFVITLALLNAVGDRARTEGLTAGYGYTPYFNAYQMLQLPYAIVAVSVITALLPRMSEHAAERRGDLVRDDFSNGLRLSSVIIVPAAVLMFALATDLATVLFAHGSSSHDDALVIGHVTQMFAIALVPFSMYQLLLRVFYAYRDTKTTAFIAFGSVATNVALAFSMYELLPTRRVVSGMAFGYGLAQLMGAFLCWAVMRVRLGGLDGRRILNTHVRLIMACVPVGIFAYAIHVGFERLVGVGVFPAFASLVIGSVGGGIIYLVAAQLVRVGEVQTMVATLTARLRPGRG